MFERILFPTDGGEGAGTAIDHLLDVSQAHDSTVHVVSVAEQPEEGRDPGGFERSDAERTVSDVASTASRRGVESVTDVLEGDPFVEIVDYARSRNVDLVVMPTRGRRGLERLFLGSTTERVVRSPDTSVLTLRPADDARIRHPYRNVLIPTDGSDCADRALDVGIDVARENDAELHLHSVVDATGLGADVRSDVQFEYLEESAEKIIDRTEDTARAEGVESVSGSVGVGASIHRELLSYVDEHDVDVVVMGTHGHTGLERYLLGSVTEKFVRTSPVPVLTVGGSGE